MKKVLTLLLAALMVTSLFACGNDSDNKTDTTPASTTAASTTAASTTAAATTKAPDEPQQPTEDKSFTLFEDTLDWAYKVFNCPYTPGSNGDAGGSFDPATDEMATYITENPEWFKNGATLTADWPKSAAPFGNRATSQSPIGWEGDAHGLMLYTTFDLTADQLALLKTAKEGDVYMNLFYDNTCYIYINSTLVFSEDASCQSGDWNEEQEPVEFNADGLDLASLFKEGTNEISVSLKDCWGGREFIMSLEYAPD